MLIQGSLHVFGNLNNMDFFFLTSGCNFQVMIALPNVELDPPTISMTFGVNDSPLAGRDGTHVSHELFSYFSLSHNIWYYLHPLLPFLFLLCMDKKEKGIKENKGRLLP